jgi:hypothetical protein
MLFQKETEIHPEEIKIDRTGNQNQSSAKQKFWKQKERIRSLYSLLLLVSPTYAKKTLSGKASLCTSGRKLRRGSLAIETALVLPLFFLGMVTLISFMDIYRIQTEHLSALCEKTKKAGMYAYVPGGGPEEITLPDIYSYEPIGGIIALPKVWMHTVVKVHAWTGGTSEDFQDASDSEKAEMVYVTENGSVYHKKAGCTYLNLSVNRVSASSVSSMRNNQGEKYKACETCSRNQGPAASVYITSSGNRYHNLESCSGLKRTVRYVRESSVDDLSACSRCGG